MFTGINSNTWLSWGTMSKNIPAGAANPWVPDPVLCMSPKPVPLSLLQKLRLLWPLQMIVLVPYSQSCIARIELLRPAAANVNQSTLQWPLVNVLVGGESNERWTHGTGPTETRGTLTLTQQAWLQTGRGGNASLHDINLLVVIVIRAHEHSATVFFPWRAVSFSSFGPLQTLGGLRVLRCQRSRCC